MSITPPFLKPGDTVGIAATARKVSPAEIAPCIQQLQNWGYRVKLPNGLYGACFQQSGTATERAADLQSLIDDTEVKAILCARGGYGSIHLVNLVNWQPMIKNPKWLAGFSDVTVLHGLLSNQGIQSLHSPMAVNFTSDPQSQFFVEEDCLSLLNDIWAESSGNICWQNEAPSQFAIEAPITGGNLSVLHSMAGTPFFPDTRGKILFIEDVDEHLYHLNRMMHWLLHSGVLGKAKALLLGGMLAMKDLNPNNPFGMTALEMVTQIAAFAGVPLVSGFPAGHGQQNMPFVLEGIHRLESDATGNCTLSRL